MQGVSAGVVAPVVLTAAPSATRTRFGKLAGSADALALAGWPRSADRWPSSAPTRSRRSGCATKSRGSRPTCASRSCPIGRRCPTTSFSPHQDLVSERLATLYRIAARRLRRRDRAGDDGAVPPRARRRISRRSRSSSSRANARRRRAALAARARRLHHVTQVVSPGEFSIRGGLIDLFPMGSALPYRIDLFDDEIETHPHVRRRHPAHALSGARGAAAAGARVSRSTTTARTRFRSRFREVFEGDPSKSPLYKDVSNGVTPGGIEYYLPLFFESTATLADYLPAGDARRCIGDVHAVDPAVLAGHRVALPAAARRPDAAAAAAHRAVLCAETSFLGRLKPFARIELLGRARRHRDDAGRPTHAAAARSGSIAAPTIRSRAQALPRPL